MNNDTHSDQVMDAAHAETPCECSSSWQKTLLEEIDAHAQDILELAGQLIRIPSPNPAGDCRGVADFVVGYLHQHGLDARIIADPALAQEGRVNVLSTLQRNADQPDARHLVLSGHYDVVPVGDESRWSFPPLAGDVVDGYVRGRGASDMKAGLAAALYAYVLIAKRGLPYEGTLSFLAVCDEEAGGHGGTDWVLNEGYLEGASAAIIAEPSERNHPTIGQKGSNWLRLTIKGQPGHGSLQPLHGVSANVLAARAILALQDLWHMEPHPPQDVISLIEHSKTYAREREGYGAHIGEVFDHVTINVGTIQGGSATNVVADQAVIEVDTRVPIGLTRAEVNEQVRVLLHRAGIEADIEAIGFCSEPNWTLASDPIVDTLVTTLRELSDPQASGVLQWASSDARSFRSHGIPVLQYGPAELATIHGFDEKAPADAVVLAAKVYALTALRYLGVSKEVQ